MGELLTDSEILAIPGIDSVTPGSLTDLIVRGVENSLNALMGYDLVAKDYVDEQIELPPDTEWEGYVPQPRRVIRTRHVPIRKFESLKVVLSWDPETGLPSKTTTISKDQYRVWAATGIIRFRGSGGFFRGPEQCLSSPAGAVLLATYRAGYSLDPEERLPEAARLALMQIIERYHTQMKHEKWNLQESNNPDGGSTRYMRVDFTPEEKMELRSILRRMAF